MCHVFNFVVLTDASHMVQWKMIPKNEELFNVSVQATRSASSRRQEFCEFMKLAQPWENDILKVGTSFMELICGNYHSAL